MWYTAADINRDLQVATKAAAYVQSRGQVPCSWATQQQFLFILRKNAILVSVVHIYPLSLFLITQFIWIFCFHNAGNWYKSPPFKLSVHNVLFFIHCYFLLSKRIKAVYLGSTLNSELSISTLLLSSSKLLQTSRWGYLRVIDSITFSPDLENRHTFLSEMTH